MNISRNNYEEFFLLYADGELNDAEKLAVESFVKLHPDLQEELELLKDTVLAHEHISMPNKLTLLKPEIQQEAPVTPQQEALLLLLDNELPASKIKELKTAIASDKTLQKEWSLLQQTKLPVETVEMPEKDTLYRKEKNRRVIPVRLARWMAAAAVLAGMGWFALNAINKPASNNPNAGGEVAGTVKSSLPSTQTSVKATTQTTTPGTTNTDTAQKNTSDQPLPELASGVKKEKFQSKAVPTKGLSDKNTITDPAPLQAINNAPQEYAVNTSTQKQPDGEPAKTVPAVTAKLTPDPAAKQVVEIVPENTVARTSSNKDEIIEDDAEYISIAGAHIKKQKIRGIFRNVTRTIGRTFDKSNVAQADNDAPINK